MAAVVSAVLFLLAVVFDAPLGSPANPGLSPNPTKAPWYFSGLQELLLHVHPSIAVFVVPCSALLFLAALPFLNYEADSGGIWFISEKGRRSALAAAVTGLMTALLWVAFDEGLPGYAAASTRLFSFVLPLMLLALPATAAFISVVGQERGMKNETVQAVFVFLAAGFGGLTVVNALFRGKGMALGWPW
jgi:hypothetical protein